MVSTYSLVRSFEKSNILNSKKIDEQNFIHIYILITLIPTVKLNKLPQLENYFLPYYNP